MLRWLGNLIQWPLSSRQAKLQARRLNYFRDDFVDSFQTASGREVAKVAWELLREEAVVADFRPKPEDDLLRVFGLADEDLDDLVLALLGRTGARVPGPAETLAMDPIEKVEDLIQFVAAFLP